MRATLPLLLVLVLACGCARQEAEPAPAGEAAGGHPALNKLNSTRKQLKDIDEKRLKQAREAEAGEAP